MCVESCASGTYAEPSTCTCDSCDSTCNTCSCGTSDCCESCSPDYLWRNTCISPCPDGEYANTVTNTCDNCMSQCATCTNNYECTKCPDENGDGVYDSYLYQKDCIDCPTRYYGDDASGTCKPCDVTCETCTGGSDS